MIEGVGNTIRDAEAPVKNLEELARSMIDALLAELSPGEPRNEVVRALLLLEQALTRVRVSIGAVLWAVAGKKLADADYIRHTERRTVLRELVLQHFSDFAAPFNSQMWLEDRLREADPTLELRGHKLRVSLEEGK